MVDVTGESRRPNVLRVKWTRIGRSASGKVQFEFAGRLRSVLNSTGGISQSTTNMFHHFPCQVKSDFVTLSNRFNRGWTSVNTDLKQRLLTRISRINAN